MKTIWTTTIKHFYGIDNLDEYREAAINRIGNQLYIFHSITNLMTLGLATYFFQQTQIAFWLLFGSNFLSFFLSTAYLLVKVNQLELNSLEVTDSDYTTVKRQKLRRLHLGMVLAAVVRQLVDALFEMEGHWDKFLTEFFSLHRFVQTLIFVLFLYIGLRYFTLKSIKSFIEDC